MLVSDQAGDGQTQRCCGCACHGAGSSAIDFLGVETQRDQGADQQRARDHVDGRRGAVIDVADPADQVGLTKPPRLARLLMMPMDAAAVAPPRKAVGSVHMMGEKLMMPAAATDNAITASVRLVPAKTLATRPTAPSTRMKTRCQRRSRRRSELRPTSTMATMATRYGMALKRPMRTRLRRRRPDQRGQVEAQRVQRHHRGKVMAMIFPDARVAQRPQQRHVFAAGVVFGDVAGDQVALWLREPGGILHAVGQDEQHADGQRNGRQRFQHEQPLPARMAADQMEAFHDPARQRVADQAGHGNAGLEDGGHLGAAAVRKPVRQIKDHARIETGLGHAEQETHGKTARRGDEGHDARQDAPGNRDARDPQARADAMHDEVKLGTSNTM